MKPFRLRSLAHKENTEKLFWRKKFSSWNKKGIWKILLSLSLILGSLGLLGVGSYIFWVLKDIPDVKELRELVFAESSTIYDYSGNTVLYNIHGEENRKYVPLADISPNMVAAILAAEDADFYRHPGVDFMGLLRSVYFLIRTGEIRGGGSTLTQQLTKNTLLTRERKVRRKIRELYLSFLIEKEFSKDDILELYLNKVSFGNNAYGIEQAARVYFGKSAKELSLAESAVLASLPQAPSKWNPYGDKKQVRLNISEEFLQKQNIQTATEFWALKTPEFSPVTEGLLGSELQISADVSVYVEGRSDYVLHQIQEKSLKNSPLEIEQARQELATISFLPYREEIKAPHFVFYVREILEQKLGKEEVEQGGLKIYTTLDVQLQQKAEELAIKNAELNDSYDVSNIALVAAEPSTGKIKAMVGSRDYWSEETDGKVNIITQRRQPGSSFKPIAYAAAFEKGLAPATVLFDVETRFGPTTPQNFDGKFRGPVSIRKALGNSLNIPAIKAGIIAGTGMYELAQKLGLDLLYDADFYGSSLALGTGETKPLSMLQAYSILAMEGEKIPLTPLLWVEDRDGNMLLDFRTPPDETEQILDPEIAYLITDTLSDAEARGPGWNSRLQISGRKNAVKTGTSNSPKDPATGRIYPKDTWTIGYTPQLATVVWAGNNRGPIKNNQASGWQNAALYWKEFMEYAHQGQPAQNFSRPEGIKTIAVDKFSGKLPAENINEEFIVTEIFSHHNAPTQIGEALRIIEIDRVSNALPTEFTPPAAKEKRVMMNFHAYNPEVYPEWEAAVQKWAAEKGQSFILENIDPQAQNFLFEIPTTSDDVHSAETAAQQPSITIKTPVNFGFVTPPIIDVFPEISAPLGLKKVELYWDGELKNTLTRAPWQGQINIGSAEKNSTHTLMVRAIDQLYYDSSAEIQVKVGTDDTPPTVSFLFPQQSSSLEGGSIYTFAAQAIDARSAVDKVIFTLNNRPLATVSQAPFTTTWTAPNTNSTYTLQVKAFDTAGNIAEKTINFSTKKSLSASTFGILSPDNNFSAPTPLSIVAGLSAEQLPNFERLEIWIKQPGGTPKLMQSFAPKQAPSSARFNAILHEVSGEYEIWAKVILSSGGTQISQKVTGRIE